MVPWSLKKIIVKGLLAVFVASRGEPEVNDHNLIGV